MSAQGALSPARHQTAPRAKLIGALLLGVAVGVAIVLFAVSTAQATACSAAHDLYQHFCSRRLDRGRCKNYLQGLGNPSCSGQFCDGMQLAPYPIRLDCVYTFCHGS